MAERSRRVVIAAVAMVTSTIWLGGKLAAIPPQDPQEPQASKLTPTLVPPPAGAITSADVDREELHDIINGLVSCGTRNSLSSWTDPNRGIGCVGRPPRSR